MLFKNLSDFEMIFKFTGKLLELPYIHHLNSPVFNILLHLCYINFIFSELLVVAIISLGPITFSNYKNSVTK